MWVPSLPESSMQGLVSCTSTGITYHRRVPNTIIYHRVLQTNSRKTRPHLVRKKNGCSPDWRQLASRVYLSKIQNRVNVLAFFRELTPFSRPSVVSRGYQKNTFTNSYLIRSVWLMENLSRYYLVGNCATGIRKIKVQTLSCRLKPCRE